MRVAGDGTDPRGKVSRAAKVADVEDGAEGIDGFKVKARGPERLGDGQRDLNLF